MRESFTPPPNEISKQDAGEVDEPNHGEILDEVDKELVRAGLEKLGDHLKNKEKEELPRIVIFPETSARPLAYAVKPLFSELYAQKKTVEPESVFFQGYTSGPLREDKRNTEKYGKDYVDLITKEVEHMDKDFGNALINYAAETKEKSGPVRELIKARAQEIVDKFNLKKGDHLLIVDDYAQTSRTTITEIRRALKECVSDLSVDAFTFISYEDSDEPQNDDVLVGSIDPRSEYGTATQGFSYRTSPSKSAMIGVEKEDIHAPDFSVSEKSTKNKDKKQRHHVQRSPERDYTLMRQIRKEMGEIGSEVAQKFREE